MRCSSLRGPLAIFVFCSFSLLVGWLVGIIPVDPRQKLKTMFQQRMSDKTRIHTHTHALSFITHAYFRKWIRLNKNVKLVKLKNKKEYKDESRSEVIDDNTEK